MPGLIKKIIFDLLKYFLFFKNSVHSQRVKVHFFLGYFRNFHSFKLLLVIFWVCTQFLITELNLIYDCSLNSIHNAKIQEVISNEILFVSSASIY